MVIATNQESGILDRIGALETETDANTDFIQNSAAERLADIAALRAATGAGPYILSDGSVWTTDGTDGHTEDEDDGISSVVNLETGALFTRNEAFPSDVTAAEAMSAARVVNGIDEIQAEWLLDSSLASDLQWPDAINRAQASFGLKGGRIILPHGNIVLGAPVIIDRPGITLGGRSTGYTGDFGNDERVWGPHITVPSGVNWGVDPITGRERGIITVRPDPSIIPDYADFTKRPRLFTKIEKLTIDAANSGDVAAIKCIAAMYFAPTDLNILDAWRGIELQSVDQAVAAWTPGSTNNFNGRNLRIQSARDWGMMLTTQDAMCGGLQIGNCGKGVFLQSCGNFTMSDAHIWNSSEGDGLRITNGGNIAFYGHVYDGLAAGISINGTADGVQLFGECHGNNRLGYLDTQPELSSDIFIGANVGRVSGLMSMDGQESYAGGSDVAYGVHALGANTDTHNLIVSTRNNSAARFKVSGRLARNGSASALVTTNPSPLFDARLDGHVWKVYGKHPTTDNAASCTVFGHATAPTVINEGSSGANGFEFIISGGFLRVQAASGALTTTFKYHLVTQ